MKSDVCNFSLSHYEDILNIALKNNYRFLFFGDAFSDDERVCYLRHDIDYTPEQAKDLALIESNLSICSTYFVQLNSPMYNIRDISVYKSIQYIKSLGHRIGLHFDSAWYAKLELEQYWCKCKFERDILKEILDLELCEIVSLHCPSSKETGKSIKKVMSVYDSRYFDDIKYVSDSQGWREDCMCVIFAKKTYKRIQLLIHPYIWPKTSVSFCENMVNIANSKKYKALDYMVTFHPICASNKDLLLSN